MTARGDRREAICEDDEHREAFLKILGQVVADFNWICHAYCLLTNHLAVDTPDANHSKGTRQLNGGFTQYSDCCHGRTGHLFQIRCKAILADSGSYLLELARVNG